jgi:hypothetical protein
MRVAFHIIAEEHKQSEVRRGNQPKRYEQHLLRGNLIEAFAFVA